MQRILLRRPPSRWRSANHVADQSKTLANIVKDGNPTPHAGTDHGAIQLVTEQVFTDHGWHWGGDWKTPDYQHFEKT
ncbi:MAG: M15 family metallopeptidase [Mycobacterium sp.]